MSEVPLCLIAVRERDDDAWPTVGGDGVIGGGAAGVRGLLCLRVSLIQGYLADKKPPTPLGPP